MRMANIAQLVNVLQSVILTDGEKMLLTPTYHVFKMYSCHQGAELVQSHIETKQIGLEEENMVPNLTESVSMKDGIVHITITNLSCSEDYEIEGTLVDSQVKSVQASIVSGKFNDHNTFDNPEKVKEETFDRLKADGNRLHFTIPANSVIRIDAAI